MKIAMASLSALALVTISGAILYKQFHKSTIEEILRAEKGLKILDTSDSEGWNNIKTTHSSTDKKGNLNIFVLKNGQEHTSNEEVSIEKIKSACEKAIKAIASPQNVAEFKAYCTKKV